MSNENLHEGSVELIDLKEIKDYYDYLKLLVESMESDILKANKGNKAASVRLRKSLRHSKDFISKFVKFTLDKS